MTDDVSLAQSVEKVLREVVQVYAPDSAVISVAEPKSGVTVIEQTPVSSRSAKIVANVESKYGLTTLIFGVGSVFEIPTTGRRYTGLAFSDEIKSLCSAVVQGRFEEIVWTRKDQIIRATGKVDVGGRIIRSSWIELFPV